MIVFIKTLDSNKFTLNINPEDTVLFLKTQIESEFQINIEKQRLIFQGYPMCDEITLSKSGVKENSLIHLLIQLI